MKSITIEDRTARAYKEIYEILSIFPDELVDKISSDKINYFYENMDKAYDYTITKETFNETPMLEETVAILAMLFRDYWATELQREKMYRFEKSAKEVMEKEKYDVTIENENVALIEVNKKGIIRRIFDKLFKLFKREKNEVMA